MKKTNERDEIKRLQEEVAILMQYLGLMQSPGNFFQMLQHLIYITGSLTDGSVLSFLLGFAQRVNRKKLSPIEDKRLSILKWFYCKSTTVEKKLLLTQRQQLPILKRLKEKGFIEMERRGMPPKRHIKINMIEIGRAIDKL